MNNHAKMPVESELSPLEILERTGIKDLDFAMRIEGEQDEVGEEIKADIYWVRYKVPEESQFSDLYPVEGKIYLPREQSNGELVHFSPGYPGGNAGRFERVYGKALAEAGYAFSTLRYNGTSFLREDAEQVFNCPARIEYAQTNDERHIGGDKEYRLSDITNQAILPARSLSGRFSRVHFIGHSMGVATNNISVTRLAEIDPEFADKVGNMVSIAGYIGGPDKNQNETTDGLKMSLEALAEGEIKSIKEDDVGATTDKKDFISQIAEIAELNKKTKIPEQVSQIMVFSPEDPVVAGPEMEQEGALKKYGPSTERKAIIQDKTGLGKKKPHNMLWISPENMVRAIKAKVPKGVWGMDLPWPKELGEKKFRKEK